MRHKPRPHQQKRQDGFRPEQKPGGRDFRPHAKSGSDRHKRPDFRAPHGEREAASPEGATKNHPFRQDRHDRKPNKPHGKHFRPHAKNGDDHHKRHDSKPTPGERETASPETATKNTPRPFRQDKFRHDRKPHGKHFRPHEKNRDARPRRPENQVQREGILLWGQHAVRAAWLNEKRRCIRLWVTEGAAGAFAKTISEAKLEGYKRPDPKRTDRDELDMLTPPGSVHQGIVLEAAALPEPALHEVLTTDNPPDLVLVLDQVTDPHNVGAIARSAAAFGVGGIIMTERNAPGLTGVLAKSASGAIEHVPLIHIVNLARAIEELQQAGYWCVGLAEEAPRDLSQCDLTGRTALVLGAEGEGLRQLTRKKCDELAKLPTGGPIGSLNVSNAAAVALYEVRRQKRKIRVMTEQVTDYFSTIASGYADYRPNYPAELFEWLAKQTKTHDLVWDCACGNGQASRDLAKHYKRIIATDASEAQIKEAMRLPNIEYRVAPAENSGLDSHSADLVTVATALHWLDFEKFYAEVKRVAKPDGLFAAWCYGQLILDDSKANATVEHFYNKTIHAYWPPHRHYVDEGYRTIPFPFREIEAPSFTMQVSWALPELLGYLRTWSSVVRYKLAHNADPVAELEKKLAMHWGHPATRRSIKWPVAMRVGHV